MIGYEERVVRTANGKVQKEKEQTEAQPDGAWGATKQTGTNGLFREPFRLQSYREQPENWSLIGDVALTNMGLGDKTAALALVERAMTVLPIEKDPFDGPAPIEILDRVAAGMGEPDRAIAALQKLLSIPYVGPLAAGMPLTPALLRLDPMFDPLRNDPRFQKLAASAALKTPDK